MSPFTFSAGPDLLTGSPAGSPASELIKIPGRVIHTEVRASTPPSRECVDSESVARGAAPMDKPAKCGVPEPIHPIGVPAPGKPPPFHFTVPRNSDHPEPLTTCASPPSEFDDIGSPDFVEQLMSSASSAGDFVRPAPSPINFEPYPSDRAPPPGFRAPETSSDRNEHVRTQFSSPPLQCSREIARPSLQDILDVVKPLAQRLEHLEGQVSRLLTKDAMMSMIGKINKPVPTPVVDTIPAIKVHLSTTQEYQNLKEMGWHEMLDLIQAIGGPWTHVRAYELNKKREGQGGMLHLLIDSTTAYKELQSGGRNLELCTRLTLTARSGIRADTYWVKVHTALKKDDKDHHGDNIGDWSNQTGLPIARSMYKCGSLLWGFDSISAAEKACKYWFFIGPRKARASPFEVQSIPMFCRKCGGPNHMHKECTQSLVDSKLWRCFRCAEQHDDTKACQNVVRCINCDGHHITESPDCLNPESKRHHATCRAYKNTGPSWATQLHLPDQPGLLGDESGEKLTSSEPAKVTNHRRQSSRSDAVNTTRQRRMHNDPPSRMNEFINIRQPTVHLETENAGNPSSPIVLDRDDTASNPALSDRVEATTANEKTGTIRDYFVSSQPDTEPEPDPETVPELPFELQPEPQPEPGAPHETQMRRPRGRPRKLPNIRQVRSSGNAVLPSTSDRSSSSGRPSKKAKTMAASSCTEDSEGLTIAQPRQAPSAALSSSEPSTIQPAAGVEARNGLSSPTPSQLPPPASTALVQGATFEVPILVPGRSQPAPMVRPTPRDSVGPKSRKRERDAAEPRLPTSSSTPPVQKATADFPIHVSAGSLPASEACCLQ